MIFIGDGGRFTAWDKNQDRVDNFAHLLRLWGELRNIRVAVIAVAGRCGDNFSHSDMVQRTLGQLSAQDVTGRIARPVLTESR
jgi:hypothetical protein